MLVSVSVRRGATELGLAETAENVTVGGTGVDVEVGVGVDLDVSAVVGIAVEVGGVVDVGVGAGPEPPTSITPPVGYLALL